MFESTKMVVFAGATAIWLKDVPSSERSITNFSSLVEASFHMTFTFAFEAETERVRGAAGALRAMLAETTTEGALN